MNLSHRRIHIFNILAHSFSLTFKEYLTVLFGSYYFSTNMLEVYLDPCTVNSRKVLAGLDLLGTQYHFNHVDYFASAHKSPEYLKINPHVR